MRIKKNFILREVPGRNIVMPTGKNVKEFAGVIILNDTAAVIYKELEKGGDRTSLSAALRREFEVDETTAGNEVDEALRMFGEAGILEN